MKSIALFSILALAALPACNNNTGNSKVFVEFQIALGEHPTNKTQCVADFKLENEDGKRTSLGNGAQVFLDSILLPFDTTVYPTYSLEKDTSGFFGNHQWKIILRDGKKQAYPFVAKPFKITSSIPSVVGDKDIVVTCNSLSITDRVFLMLNGDRATLDIKPQDGSFTIPASFWKEVDAEDLTMWFNISTRIELPADSIISGGFIEATRVTRDYRIQLKK